MWKQHREHKTIPKILAFILSLLMVLSVAVPMFTNQTLDVHATSGKPGYDGGQGSGTGHQRGDIGASYKETAILLYIADANTGEPVTGSVIVGKKYYGGMQMNLRSKLVNGHTENLGSKGLVIMQVAEVPYPVLSVNNNWKPNGDEIRKYLTDPATTGEHKYEAILRTAFAGQSSVWDEIHANPSAYNVVVHALCRLHIDGSTNILYTTDGAAEDYERLKGGTHTFVHGGMYNCMITYENHWGVAPPSVVTGVHSPDLGALQSTGWGIHVLNIGPSDAQTTCDESKGGTPSKPPEESNGMYKIVKTYRTVDASTGAVISDDGSYEKEDSSANIVIEDESLYKLVAWKTSSTHQCSVPADGWHSKVPATIKRSGTTPTSIVMASGENTVYLLLEKEQEEIIPPAEGNFIISQSTISRKIKLSIPDVSAGYTNIKDLTSTWHSVWHWTSCHIKHECDGCQKHSSGSHSEGTYKEWWTCPGHDCGGWGWKDQSTVFSLQNTLRSNYPDILATKGNIQAVTKTGADESAQWYRPYTRTNTGTDDKQFKDWDYACVIMRGKDKLTVAKWKNNFLGCAAANTDLQSLSSSGFAIDNKANGHRKLHDYEDSFNISLNKLSNGNTDYVTTYRPTTAATGGGICPADNCTYSLKQTLDALVKVKVETYAGKQAGTTSVNTTCESDPSIKPTFGGTLKSAAGTKTISSYTKRRGVEVYSANIGFRPYVQMNYDTFSYRHEPYSASTANHKTAYVLGEYDRTVSVNDYAEVSWKPTPAGHPNLSLNSLQWSTHASVKNYVGVTLGVDPSVWTALPGGATLSLSIEDSDRQTVMATSYQCVVDGTGMEQIENTSGSSYTGPTISSADGVHDAYVQTVIQGLENLNVEQWAVKGVDTSKDVWGMSGASAVHPNLSLSMIGRPNQKASSEEKYYLWDEGKRAEAPASEGDLDVKEGNTYIETYTFFTNTYGEIRYIVGNTSGNKTNEKAGVDITGGLDNISKQINDRTHVVDKLRDAVEQKKGNDPTGRSKTGTEWYSEAFDGITVYVQSTELTVGYIDPPQRSTVLDTRLTQEQDNQSDMFNEGKYNQSQYRTKSFSEIYGSDDEVGQYRGTPVLMDEMNMLFWSKPFLIPNATVDDLH